MKGLTLLAMPLLAMCMTLSGCVFIESSAITGRSGNGKSVTTSASDYGILGLTIPSGLTGAANSQLAAQCPGNLTNVQTELSVRNFIVVQLYDVTATAVCE